MTPNDLTKYDADFLIKCIQDGIAIPDEYKYILFPAKQKEYELTYEGKMRREDVLADNEEAKAVPLQTDKWFNSGTKSIPNDEWSNLLIFGDNLQVLKTAYENEDPLIKGKVKGKVKLIYIDPPFATASDFKQKDGAKAYSDRKKGAEFVEFLRRRLILAREILADDGSIFVHLDGKKAHYIKVVMDEVFGESNFRNEIVWHYRTGNIAAKQFQRKHDTILFYSKSDTYTFNILEFKEYYVQVYGPTKKISFKGAKDAEDKYGRYRMSQVDDVWDISAVFTLGGEHIDYPTQKPEALIERIVRAGSNEGDIVMDFFSGSGTTLAVAEKLGRKWIGSDIGKLSIYTTQKRLLDLTNSKDLTDSKKKYGKCSRPFGVVTSGLYDLNKVFELKSKDYVEFVKRLYEVEDTKVTSIGGVSVDGKKRDFYTKIFPYWEFEDANVDEAYLTELHKNLGTKVDGRLYIIAPANNVDFISDYFEINGVRYYFLKVPYQIIKELHKVQFKKLRQPQSKKHINDLDEAVGFHFVRQPDVTSKITIHPDEAIISIEKFASAYSSGNEEKLDNLASLAMVFLDLDYNGEYFKMTDYYFAEDLVSLDTENDDADEELIREELKKQHGINIKIPTNRCGKNIMALYVDIYGNEFRETFEVNK